MHGGTLHAKESVCCSYVQESHNIPTFGKRVLPVTLLVKSDLVTT